MSVCGWCGVVYTRSLGGVNVCGPVVLWSLKPRVCEQSFWFESMDSLRIGDIEVYVFYWYLLTMLTIPAIGG